MLFFFFFPVEGESLTSKEVERLKKYLQYLYTDKLSKIKTSRLDFKSQRTLEELYQQLYLCSYKRGERPIAINYSNLFNIITEEKSRTVLVGQAGVGKTTLLAKIALDWAKGEKLETIDLLFLFPLCETEKNKQFAKISKWFVSDKHNFTHSKLSNYMQANQNKIMLLFDGLDAYKSADIKRENSNDAFMEIMRGKKLECAPVIVTRTWRAEEITSIEKVYKNITPILVEGFNEENVREYIKRFFEDDEEVAEGLIHLTTDPEGSIIAQTMAGYPIVCSMLCGMWQWLKDSDRKRISKLNTFSELIIEFVNVLVEQYWLQNPYASLEACKSRCNESFSNIGKVALDGLMNRKLSFDAGEVCVRTDDIKIGCDLGVLTSKKKKGDIKYITEISFPDKLMQEYLAGYYLAKLYLQDPLEFEGLLVDNVLAEYKEYIHIFYFTAAHWKGPEQTGKHLIEVLCKAFTGDNMEEDYLKFLVDIAFEYHDEGAIDPVIDFLQHIESISLNAMLLEYQHTWLGFIYTLAACGKQQVKIVFE